MKINKYIPFAFIYLFVNSLGLPFGLTYTALLSPFFYCWTVVTRKKEILLFFFIALIPFSIFHLQQGVDGKAYIVSVLNLITVYIFCQAFYTFLKNCQNLEIIFRKLLIVNFVVCIIAVPLYFTPYYNILWIEQYLTKGINSFKRLKLFTYEASYYATLLMPIFSFYLLQIFLKQNKLSAFILLPMLFLPYILSFSLGVISATVIATVITYLLYFKSLTRKKRLLNSVILGVALCVIGTILLVIFYPENSLFIRMSNIFAGKDNSGNGRTYEAFMLADKIIQQHSVAWGIGPGQLKIFGGNIIRNYYQYPLNYPITIPNAAAETLTLFGWVGLSLRLLMEIFLFFYTRVWTNYYRLFLFVFIFIYQFTGSFITNIAEYVIWIIAFTNAFTFFDTSQRSPITNEGNSKPDLFTAKR